MGARHVLFLEPAGRAGSDVLSATAGGEVKLTVIASGQDSTLPEVDLVLVAPGAADALYTGACGSSPRWVIGEPSAAARLAGAAVTCGAVGVLLRPVTRESLSAAIAPRVGAAEADLARARSLVAASVLGFADNDAATLATFAAAFAADDCIVWWRDGDTLEPHSARPSPVEGYRSMIATAARIAAAANGTTITAGETPRAVMAAPLRPAPGEVAGLVAIISDHAHPFSVAERADLRALANRLERELSVVSGHRRLLAEDERLRAASLHDPLTGALTRSAFEQAVTTAVAGANRRQEPLTLAVIDVVGLRRINLRHGHRAGDEVLAQIAARVRATVRGNNPVGRFGGDELAVLLVGADDAHGLQVAQKLVARIADPPMIVDGQPLDVQVRGAVSPFGVGERSGEAAFARALSALRGAQPGAIAVAAADVRADGDAALDQAGLASGTTLGGTYRVLHELSRGAMGVVYRAEDLGLGRPVAIKVLRSDLAQDRDLVTKFRAEAAMLASLHHKNLVQVFTLGEHAGDVYFVMELVEGQPLAEVMRQSTDRGEWLPNAAIAQIAIEMADALDAMHAVGLIHRDVKPANVLLDRDRDRAVLVDVGVAMRAGDRREAAGTPGYSAPESFLDAPQSPASDVYGLAATVYAALTGQPPFGSGALQQVLGRQLHSPLVPASQLRPSLSTAVDEVLAKALDPNPKKRWASAGTFGVALTSALERAPVARVEHASSAPPFTHAPTQRAGNEIAEIMQPTAALDAPIAFPRPPAVGRVRGAHFRVAGKILGHRLGGAALRAMADASPALASALSPDLSPVAWEPAEVLVDLLDRCHAHDATDELARQIGRGTITATFTRFFGANPASLPTETVLRAAPAFWGRYHDWARIHLARAIPGLVELSLDRAPGSARICTLVGGELERVTQLAGAADVVVEHDRCACRGAPVCSYRITWTA